MMKRSILLLIAATTVAGAISYLALASEHAEENSQAKFDWSTECKVCLLARQ